MEFDKAKFNADLVEVSKSMTLNLDSKLATTYFYFDLVLQEWCFMNGIPRNNNTNTPKPPKEGKHAHEMHQSFVSHKRLAHAGGGAVVMCMGHDLGHD